MEILIIEIMVASLGNGIFTTQNQNVCW